MESKRSLRRPRRSTLIQDSLTIDRLRSYPNPLAQRNLANEIDSKTVQTMMAVTEEHYGFAQDYFGLKAKLLELPRLAFYDQYAPVGKEAAPFPYGQAQQVILDAFEPFDPKFRQIAGEFFANHWIGAEIRNGKRSGAFCGSPSPRFHPYILCNYDDNMRRKAPSERPYFILKLGGTTSSMLFPDQCHLGTLSQTCSPLT